jgi:phosphoserine phosphatase RsbU/P
VVQRFRARLGGRAPTVGLLVDWLEDGYQRAIISGAHAAAKAVGVNLLCFSGGVLRSPVRSAKQRNHVYELVAPENVDAVMLLSGTLGNHVGPEELNRFCDRYRALPMCSIAVELEGMPSVLIDNEVGMRSALSHLIRVHNHHRIAFVRGPVANAEAERRFRAYRQALEEGGLTLDERLIVVGDFQPESGREAVRILFDERGIKPSTVDAFVTANDTMALGVLEALEQRGIRVPAQMALVGFDDIEDARCTKPPLTTVRQPLEDQGRRAVSMVLSALQHGRRADTVVLSTELVVRASCGCFDVRDKESQSALPPQTFSFEAAMIDRRERIVAKLRRASRGTFAAAGSDWEVRLVNAFVAEVRGATPGGLSLELELTLEKVLARGVDLSVCHEVLTELRRQVLPCLSNDPERRAAAEDALHQARRVASGTIERLLAREQLKNERWVRTLSEAGASLIAASDIKELSSEILSTFPSLGIDCCFVALYQGDEAPSAEARLVLRYDRQFQHRELRSAVFSARTLLPPELLTGGGGRRSLAVLPLFFRQDVLGFMVIELEPGRTFAYETVRDLVSAAIKGAELVEQAREARGERDGATHELTRERLFAEELERALLHLRGAVDDLPDGVPQELTEAVRRADAILERIRRRKATPIAPARDPSDA